MASSNVRKEENARMSNNGRELPDAEQTGMTSIAAKPLFFVRSSRTCIEAICLIVVLHKIFFPRPNRPTTRRESVLNADPSRSVYFPPASKK